MVRSGLFFIFFNCFYFSDCERLGGGLRGWNIGQAQRVLFCLVCLSHNNKRWRAIYKQLYTISTDDYYSESCWTEKQSSEMISFFF